MRLKIAARKSDLARLQAYRVGEALKSAHPQLEVEYLFKESLGDKNLEDPLWKMPERGVFTEDFRSDLLAGEVDLVVHSWKDLPVETREGSEIVATLPRADSRDLFLLKKKSFGKKSLKIFSSSPRRAYTLPDFLDEYLPFAVTKVEFMPVRGNIPTRLQKYREQEVDGLVVAKAALDRLLSAPEAEFTSAQQEIRKALELSHWMVLPLELQPTAAAQGALAIEIKTSRSDLKELLSAVHCQSTFETVQEERKILAEHGGGCHQKIGVSVIRVGEFGTVTYLRGETDKGDKLKKTQFVPSGSAPKFSKDEKWPDNPEEQFLFARESLSAFQPRKAEAFFIARSDALPDDWRFTPETLVWTAGLLSWKKLAERGVWVHGSTEGRGEVIPEVTALAPKIKFTKLSHDGAPSEGMPMIPTYKLSPRPKKVDFRGKKFYFWMSGTAFDEATRQEPSILSAEHASGPGNTFEHLRKKLPKDKKIHVFLSYKQWREW